MRAKTRARTRSNKAAAPKNAGMTLAEINAKHVAVDWAAINLATGVEGYRLGSPEDIAQHAKLRARLIETDSAERKHYPICTGLLDYFPDACAAVAEVSYLGNLKHNPGEPMHHARGKSMDHADCIARHLAERGGFDAGIRHSAALAWRAMALLQEELEREYGFLLPRGAKE
ncbi:MAG TPA: dATP/dGTP diphosphohydrolase domain-containing protein [Ktedonobacteraceae bacterium]|nr:dATP/dGTP diphosphohydrolase domain-containing protein [Ktedonobacteraceae bacterium]